ncbi:hypothetical protein CoNPh26_CDS0046 [Staphylococcus phage S-CoN_Ph26]|nr:hypothetical protein CoNPh26_CDS0046 [Staphylococcus phage S-CoN_Ph26]
MINISENVKNKKETLQNKNKPKNSKNCNR